jgi:D-sedoheptulose 7-phosphate isomerase
MIGYDLRAGEYLSEIGRVEESDLNLFSDVIYQAWVDERSVFIVGNGGSGATASHMSEDLGKNLQKSFSCGDRRAKRLRVMSLTDNVAWIMAVSNDLSYEEVFVQQLMNYGRAGDVLVALSGSGNSPNVLRAVDWANTEGIVTFGLTGFDGGMLKVKQSHGIHVAVSDMGMVESIHLCIFHWVLDDLHARINGVGRYGTLTSILGSN